MATRGPLAGADKGAGPPAARGAGDVGDMAMLARYWTPPSCDDEPDGFNALIVRCGAVGVKAMNMFVVVGTPVVRAFGLRPGATGRRRRRAPAKMVQKAANASVDSDFRDD